MIGGWSWGGYITLLRSAYPDRFTAGVAGAPVGDYAGSYDEAAPSLQAWDRSLFGGVVTEMPSSSASARRSRTRTRPRAGAGPDRRARRAAPEAGARLRGRAPRGRRRGRALHLDEGHNSYVVDEEIREWRAVLEFLRRRISLP